MVVNWRAKLLLGALLPAAAWIFITGTTWGLPSQKCDAFLFGSEPVWSGKKILELTGGRRPDPARGADVDVNPLTGRDKIVCVNETDRQRAEILIRYRLFTYQPDEMITMMSLASMDPSNGDFDPKLYQYGGLWIYPVGALLKIASLCGFITLTPDLSYYLDRPEEFGRFYVLSRLYSAAWALVGVWAVFWIVHRLTKGSLIASVIAAACYMTMPVVINMAHEAKPHMPAAVMMLLVILAAMRYVDTGKLLWWIITSCLCGAAFGMVLSALPIFIVLPTMMLLRKRSWPDWLIKTLVGGTIGVAVYLLTNPYILINLLVNRQVLRSNFANSLAMYEISRLGKGFFNAARLVGEGVSPVLAIVGAISAIVLGFKSIRAFIVGSTDHAQSATDRRRAAGWLPAMPALLILLQFISLAAGKPGEYGRFAVFPDIALGTAAVIGIQLAIRQMAWRRIGLVLLVILTAWSGSDYLRAFIADSRIETTRLSVAHRLGELRTQGINNIGILAEPSPYILPPVDLFNQRILLLPAHTYLQYDSLPADVIVGPRDIVEQHVDLWTLGYRVEPKVFDPFNYDPTPISWANKLFILVMNKERGIPASQESVDHVPDHRRQYRSRTIEQQR